MDEFFPGSAHVHELGLAVAPDREVWRYARDQGYATFTKDADFGDLATAWGFPPKVIWIRLGNSTPQTSEALLRTERGTITQALEDPEIGVLSLG